MENQGTVENGITETYVRLLVSRNLRRLRSMQGMSQQKLAHASELTHNFVNDIESGKKGVSVKTLAKLSVALGVEPYQFFLPEDMSDSRMQVYVSDFNDSLGKIVKGLTDQYLAEAQQQGSQE